MDQVVAREFGQVLGCKPAGAFPVTADSQPDDLDQLALPARPPLRSVEAALARILASVASPRVHACHALAARLIADRIDFCHVLERSCTGL